MNEAHMTAERRAEFASAEERLPVRTPVKTSEPTPVGMVLPAVAEGHRGNVELIERLADEWRELCDAGPTDQPFYRPEWVRAHLRAFVPQKKLLLVTARVGGVPSVARLVLGK